jgi:hypothetical protein
MITLRDRRFFYCSANQDHDVDSLCQRDTLANDYRQFTLILQLQGTEAKAYVQLATFVR